MKKRSKKWEEKVEIVSNSILRSSREVSFPRQFYENLFFLNPQIKDYFKNTDFQHQDKALMQGLEFLLNYINKTDDFAKKQIIRLAKTHSHKNLNIHPHHYYYWIDALIMTGKKSDPDWYDDMEFYWREVFSLPIFFMISQYFSKD